MVGLSLLWPYECPNRLTTVLCGLAVYSAGFWLIRTAFKKGFIGSVAGWNVVFILKLAVSWIILVCFWVGPMQPDLFRAAGGDHFDGMLYDYHAAAIAEEGWGNAGEHLNFTWLSFGVVAYAASIYTIFGISLLHVAYFNVLLVLVMSLAITMGVSVAAKSFGRFDVLKWTMLLPFGSFYDAIVTKDTLSNSLYAVCFACAVYIFGARRNVYSSWGLLAAALVALVIVRINLAAMVLLGIVLLGTALRRISFLTLSSTLLVAFIGGVLFININPFGAAILRKILTPSEYFAGQQSLVDRVSDGASPLRVMVAEATVPRSLLGLAVLSPLRSAIWVYSPYPEIVPVKLGSAERAIPDSDPEALAKWLALILGCASAWIICFESPQLLSFAGSWRKWISHWPGMFVLWIFLLMPILITANLTFVGARRYRTMIEPLLLAATVCSAKLSPLGRFSSLVVYLGIFLPLMAYWLYQIL